MSGARRGTLSSREKVKKFDARYCKKFGYLLYYKESREIRPYQPGE